MNVWQLILIVLVIGFIQGCKSYTKFQRDKNKLTISDAVTKFGTQNNKK